MESPAFRCNLFYECHAELVGASLQKNISTTIRFGLRRFLLLWGLFAKANIFNPDSNEHGACSLRKAK